jgi:hypothetical protein
MTKLFSIVLVIVGLALILYFGYVFIIFSASDNPLLLPFITEPILFSLILFGIGLIVFVIGVISILKLRSNQKK